MDTKLIKNMIYILILIIAFAIVINCLYKRTNHFNNQFIDVRKFWPNSERKNNLQVVNLGSNHPKFGIDYSDINVNGENWAVGPQTFEYDFAILRQNISYLAPGATVIIPVCLLNFFLYRQNNRFIHTKYYSFLDKKDIVDYSIIEKFKNYYFPGIMHPKNALRILKDVKKDERLLLTNNPMKTEAELNADGDMWLKSWGKEFSISLPNPTLSQQNISDIRKNIEILKEMLCYCKDKGLKPVITILPVTDYLYSRFSEEFINNHVLSYIQKANVVNVPVLNYLNDQRFTSVDKYINTFFMNAIGRKEFTRQLLYDLKTIHHI